MRVAGLRMSDSWAHRVRREPSVETIELTDQPAELRVLMERVHLRHHGAAHNYRPLLHLSGELRSIRLTGTDRWPGDISEVTFSPGRGEPIDACYEFDDEQLLELVRRGYFSPDFRVPDTLIGIEWEIPATIDSLVVPPTSPDDVPIVFTRVHRSRELEITLESSDYDLTVYFADVSRNPEPHQSISGEEMKARSDALDNLFSDDELRPTTSVPAPSERQPETAAPDKLEREVQAARERLAQQDEDRRAAKEAEVGTTEHLYRFGVARQMPGFDPPTVARDRVPEQVGHR